jgi:hypothetical protein
MGRHRDIRQINHGGQPCTLSALAGTWRSLDSVTRFVGREGGRITDLVAQAAWVLVAAFVLSFVYELYRATAKAGTSRHDSMQSFAKNNIAFYALATIVIALLFAGFEWAPWIGLLFSGGAITASILYYNPKIMLERAPGIVDWSEDIVFTGLLFVAATLLLYKVLGLTLQP